ncbi:hypothetical protein AVEN_144261-1, partial [Araneus ventricosus]
PSEVENKNTTLVRGRYPVEFRSLDLVVITAFRQKRRIIDVYFSG